MIHQSQTPMSEQDSVQQTLGRLDGKMDMVLTTLQNQRLDHQNLQDEIQANKESADARLMSLEKWRSLLVGGWTVLFLACTVIGYFLTLIF